MQEQIDQALVEKINALKAIVATHNLIQQAHFNFAQLQQVTASTAFLQSLHTNLMTEALAHPDADKVAELREEKSRQAEKEAELESIKEKLKGEHNE